MTIYGWDRKLVIYERSNPAIRFVILFSDPDPVTRRQRIAKYMLEWDPKTHLIAIRRAMKELLDEFCKIEVRGRPRGTGHPKQKVSRNFPIAPHDVDRLRKTGLNDRDLRILFSRSAGKKLKQIAQELGISVQAVSKRWTHRIQPAIRRLNPSFSSPFFKMTSLDSK